MQECNDNTPLELKRIQILLQAIMEEDEAEATMEDTSRLF
jgi:hypothetical protein